MRIALILVLLAGCDFQTPGEKAALAKVADLEKRLADAESRAGAAKMIEAARQASLDACLEGSDEIYWRYVKLNGRQKKPGSDIWIARTDVWTQAAQEKRNAIEECRARYAQR